MKPSLGNNLFSFLVQKRIAQMHSGPLRLETRTSRFMVSAILFLLPFFIPLYHDAFRAYITTPDMDLAVASVVLNFNSGLTQPHYDHTGYVNFLLLSWWIKAGGVLGLIPAADWKTVLASADPEHAYAQVVIAGRFYSMLMAGVFSIVFYLCLRVLTDNRFAALLGGLLFATSNGLAHQALILRPEQLSSLFVITAFLYLLKASRQAAATGSAIAAMAIAGSAAMLAMMTKIQVVFSLLLIPVVVLLFGRRAGADLHRANSRLPDAERTLYLAAAVAFATPAIFILLTYLRATEIWPGPYDRWSGYYQGFVMFYIAAASIAYARLYSLSLRAWGEGMLALVVGMLSVLYLNFLHFLDFNIVALANFVDWLKHYSALANKVDSSFADIAGFIAVKFHEFWTRRLAWETLLQQPILALQWIIIAGIAYLFSRKEWKGAVQVSTLLAISLLQEIAFSLRYVSSDYKIYLEPWAIMAFTLLVSHVLRMRPSRFLRKTVLATVAAGFVIASIYANMDRANILSVQGGNNVCPFTQGTPIYPIAKKYCDPDTQLKYQINP